MEVRIGIKDSPREISLETEQSAADVRAAVEAALVNGAPLVSLTDAKGSQFLVVASSIAYVELGGETPRKVGFIS